jgi:hypothetical protein
MACVKMVTYISQQILNQQGGVLQPGQVLDTSIQSPTPQQVLIPSQQPQPIQPPSQPNAPTQLSYSDRQQILYQQGLGYGNPDAPEYQSLFANVQNQPQQSITSNFQPSISSTTNNGITSYYAVLPENLLPTDKLIPGTS